ncbi:hypothetical protein [Paenibacillus sp. P22]|uniref:hypothetical protein n=1 Tax=Paenibacillus sp. P22 TaxID=483908 RepID=UPI0004343700|nr:hypothetical protein [Paenibacillus sp. P22]CDN44393.1 hypothetical protein BN871_EU_00080 [Paenibacillus sp. P22]
MASTVPAHASRSLRLTRNSPPASRRAGGEADRHFADHRREFARALRPQRQLHGGLLADPCRIQLIQALHEHALVDQARRTQSIVLADHAKVGSIYYCRTCGLEEIDIVVSDIAPPMEWAPSLEEKDVHWIVAD